MSRRTDPKPDRKTYTERDRARALEIYVQFGPREAARQIGCTAGTVTKWAKAAGVETLRTTQTQAATEARAADNARRLEDLKARLLEEAQKALDELHTKTTVHNWHQGEFRTAEIAVPTFTDKRNIMWRAGGAILNFLKIDAHQGGGEDLSQVDEWLDAMAGEA